MLPPPVADHDGDDGLHAKPYTAQVRIDHIAPAFVGEVHDVVGAEHVDDAGHVREMVDRPEGFLGLVEEASPVAAFAHVHLHVDGLPAPGGDLFGGGFVGLEVCDHHACPFRGTSECRRLADPLDAAADDRHLAVKSLHNYLRNDLAHSVSVHFGRCGDPGRAW